MIVNQRKKRALDDIAYTIEHCSQCREYGIGKAVPGEGNPDANVVFIGEAPGKNEAQTGRPFIGRAGKLLRSLIAEVGLTDEEVYITSPVKYLPVYVTPKPSDIAHGKIHLDAQLAVIKPKIIVSLGRVAARALLDEDIVVGKEHGTIRKKNDYLYFIAYHPAAPLHSPKLRSELRKDFEKLTTLLKDSSK